jgi:hypothetical protein
VSAYVAATGTAWVDWTDEVDPHGPAGAVDDG